MDNKICYVCGNAVDSKEEQRKYLNLGNDDMWKVAEEYSLEWTYHNVPSDMEKYTQKVEGEDGDYEYCEIVCQHCIDIATKFPITLDRMEEISQEIHNAWINVIGGHITDANNQIMNEIDADGFELGEEELEQISDLQILNEDQLKDANTIIGRKISNVITRYNNQIAMGR